MAVSILHRICGNALAFGAAVIFVWWLVAAASGAEAYATFLDVFTLSSGKLNIIGYVFAVGLTWSVLQHMSSGIRHFVLDTGAGYELKINKLGSMIVCVVPILLTALIWGAFFMTRG